MKNGRNDFSNALKALIATLETQTQLEAAERLLAASSETTDGTEWVVSSLSEVAAFFGISDGTVRNWSMRVPKIPGEAGRWPLREIVRWRLDWVSGTELTEKKRQQDYDLQQIKLESERLDLLEKQGQLLHKDDVELWAAAAIVEFREVVMQLKEMLTASAPPELKDFVRTETDRHCRDALTAAARRLELVQIGEKE